MNKLEEQMEEQTDIFYDPTAGEKDYFKAGAQFVIDLELMEGFAEARYKPLYRVYVLSMG